MEYLENQSKRNNIRVNGIPESDNETWEEQKLVKRAIKDNLGIEVVDIERAYRVERRKTKSGQNKPESAENHLGQIKRLETEGAGFAQS